MFSGVFVFPGPRPFAWSPALALAPGPCPQFVFTSPGPKFVFTGPCPQFVFTGPCPQFVFTGSGLQFVFTGPGPKFVFTGLGSKFLFTGPGSKFLSTGLGQSETWACRYQPCPPNLYLLALTYDFYYRALNLHLPSYL